MPNRHAAIPGQVHRVACDGRTAVPALTNSPEFRLHPLARALEAVRFMKRILITPTSKGTVFVTKALGSASRGLVQFPVMVAAALAFGVSFNLTPLQWAAWILGLMLLATGFCSLFLAITARSTDWQTPGVVSNFITMPLMFASTALFSAQFFPAWMVAISRVNPITFSALLGRSFVLGTTVPWENLGFLALFAAGMLAIGFAVSSRWLKVE